MRLALLILALVLAGCASGPNGTTGASTTPPTTTSAPSPDGPGAGCGAGPGPVFLKAASGGGFVPQSFVPHLVEITHTHVIRILQGFTTEGAGRIVENKPGALHDLTEQDARDMLARRNISLDARDMNVTRGDKATLPDGLYASFCQHVVDALPTLKDEYPNVQGCADEGSRIWDVSITGAQRTIVVDDCAGDDAAKFRELQHELDTLVGPGETT